MDDPVATDKWGSPWGYRQTSEKNPGKFDQREYLKPAREAAMKICRQRYQQFGCEGQGAKIKALPLSVVAQRYSKGELAQVVQ